MVSGCGVGGGSLGYANTLYRARPAFYADPQWAAPRRLEARARAALRRGRADARRRRRHRSTTPPTTCCASSADHIGVERDLRQDPRRRVLRRAGRHRRRPVLRRRGPAAHRLRRACGALHGRLSARREEHAGEELPVVRREARRARSSPSARSSTSGRSARRDGSRRLRGRPRALGRVAAQGPPGASARAASSSAAGALGTNQLLQRCKRGGSLPRISDRLGELVRTNSEAILAVTAPDGLERHDQARRDQRLDLPRPRHAHRDRQLRRRPATASRCSTRCSSATARA